MTTPLEPLAYKLHDVPNPQLTENLEILGPIEQLPFRIRRTKNNNLPVYRDYKYKRAKKMTEIRSIEGDVDAFVKELRKVCSNAAVSVKVGKVQVTGIHKRNVVSWLYRLGF